MTGQQEKRRNENGFVNKFALNDVTHKKKPF